MTDCIFCKIISGSIPCAKVYENDRLFVFLDAKPAGEGHMLVVPKHHCADILDAHDQELQDMMLMGKKLGKALMEQGADGFNIIINTRPAAGQVVFHTHMHVVPRKEGDGIHWTRPQKMPSNEELVLVAEKLRSALE